MGVTVEVAICAAAGLGVGVEAGLVIGVTTGSGVGLAAGLEMGATAGGTGDVTSGLMVGETGSWGVDMKAWEGPGLGGAEPPAKMGAEMIEGCITRPNSGTNSRC
jgi:hypothetical protein